MDEKQAAIYNKSIHILWLYRPNGDRPMLVVDRSIITSGKRLRNALAIGSSDDIIILLVVVVGSSLSFTTYYYLFINTHLIMIIIGMNNNTKVTVDRNQPIFEKKQVERMIKGERLVGIKLIVSRVFLLPLHFESQWWWLPKTELNHRLSEGF